MAKLTMEQYERKLKRWQKRFPDDLKKVLARGGEKIISVIHREHLSGPYMGKGRTSETRATLAVRSGRLKNSVNRKVRVKSGDISLKVGTNVVYAGVHEHGWRLRNIPKRAYLWPSVQKKRPEILDDLAEGMVGSYDKAR